MPEWNGRLIVERSKAKSIIVKFMKTYEGCQFDKDLAEELLTKLEKQGLMVNGREALAQKEQSFTLLKTLIDLREREELTRIERITAISLDAIKQVRNESVLSNKTGLSAPAIRLANIVRARIDWDNKCGGGTHNTKEIVDAMEAFDRLHGNTDTGSVDIKKKFSFLGK